MTHISTEPTTLHHHKRKMGGRDPHEAHRVATPLELLFDLTFVTSFGLAAAEFSHLLASGHFSAGLIGFTFASFAICWAWINFSWFASAFDTDDWIFRLTTMIQMIGVLVVAIGLPRMFASIEHGEHFDNSIIVLGYVIMRAAMVFQWLRAAKQDPAHRRSCLTYAAAISIAQIGWIAQIFIDLSITQTFMLAGVLAVIEMMGPVIAESKDGGTPWHAHHIVERYSLFAIIALGEGVVGTVASLSAAIEHTGLTLDTILICIAGIGLTFGLWWIYYILPSAPVLSAHRNRSFVWGYSQMIIVASIVAIGAALHVAAYALEGKASISSFDVTLIVAIPITIFLAGIYALYTYLTQRFDRFHILLLSLTMVVIALALWAAQSGVSMAFCLLILTGAPVVTIIGYEMLGHRHQSEALADMR